jgi:transglutaminase-like putative cysteine protease
VSPRGILALAVLTTLLLLARVADGGSVALGGAVLIVVLGSAANDLERREHHAGSLRLSVISLLPTLLAVGIVVSSLFQLALSPTPPPGLAWFARVLCVVSAALLFRTPPQALVLHSLAVLLGLWTASALRSALDPLTALGSLIALALAIHGLVRARAHELRSGAANSVSVGVAPTPWGRSRSRWPALSVVLLSLLPFALDWELPRLRLAASKGAASTTSSVPSAERRVAPRRVRFSPDLALDAGHEGLVSPNERVALVTASPAPTVLFLRGATLARSTDAGFAAAPGPPVVPRVSIATRNRQLNVDLFAPEHGYLFHTGRPQRWSGVDWRRVGDTYRAASDTTYPLRYSVSCEVADQSIGAADLAPTDAPSLLQLPPSLQADPRLQTLVSELAANAPTAPQRAAATLNWLAINTRYDGAHRVEGGTLAEAVTAFLFESRKGICVEFATAATVLLRLLGVPTRVVTGYRSHERDEGRFVIRARHAHAWIEVAYDGAGWVTYDPTPAEPVAMGPSPQAPAPGPAAAAAVARSEAPAQGRWLTLLLALCSVAGVAVWLGGRQRIAQHVRLAKLARDSVSSVELLGDRARFFAVLEARGFDLEGSETPKEWIANWPTEPELRDAIEHYSFLRFSGQTPEPRVAAFRRSLAKLR